MSAVRSKIEAAISAKNILPLPSLKEELDVCDERSTLEDLYRLHQEVESGEVKVGTENKLNSKVAYALGVTSKAPEGDFELDKRRTYGRDGFPDIDMDFDYERRHEIVDYLFEKYGREYVGNIGTVQTLKTKAALRRVIKVLDPDNNIIFDDQGKKIKDHSDANFMLENKILKTLPGLMKRPDGSFVNTVDDAYKEYSEFREYMDQYPEVRRLAARMEGGISAYGVHAAGLVISPIPLAEICPLHQTHSVGSNKVIATQFTQYEVESLGLIKLDVLGLSTKTAIGLAQRMIKERHGVDIDLSSLPLDDQKTLDLLNSGKTDGCFQLENYGMKQTLQQIGIHSFDDLVVAVAMYRPGPKDYIPLFSKRKRGEVPVSYPHPVLEKIVKRTYGIMAYQEQVMQVFMAMADLTATDGYTFMKGCAKKKVEIIEDSKDKFVKGSLANGIPQAVIDKIWSDMEKFAGYAFNKSHACSYAYESFKTAYLKAHYPMEFISARLTTESVRRNFDDVAKYTADARDNWGLKIHPPDLNRSKLTYTIVGEKDILEPLLIKGIGDKAAEEIINNQPYKGPNKLYDFAMRVGSMVNAKVVEAMYDEGLWGKYPGGKKKLLSDFEQIRKDKKNNRGRPEGDLFE